MRPELLNALTLAYLGDALFEVYIREYLILEKGITKPNDLQKASVSYVSAVAQAYFMKVARESGFLTPKELAIYKRGRNTKAHNKSHSRTLTHNQSSGFEALIGHLYLIGNQQRIDEIVTYYKQVIESKEEQEKV